MELVGRGLTLAASLMQVREMANLPPAGGSLALSNACRGIVYSIIVRGPRDGVHE